MRKLFSKNAQVSGIRDPLPISPQKIQIQILLCKEYGTIGPQNTKKSEPNSSAVESYKVSGIRNPISNQGRAFS